MSRVTLRGKTRIEVRKPFEDEILAVVPEFAKYLQVWVAWQDDDGVHERFTTHSIDSVRWFAHGLIDLCDEVEAAQYAKRAER